MWYCDTILCKLYVYATLCVCLSSPKGLCGCILYLFIVLRGEWGGGEQISGGGQSQSRAGGGTQTTNLQVSLSLCTLVSGALHLSINFLILSLSLPLSLLPVCLLLCLSGCCWSPLRQASVKVSAHLRQKLKEIQWKCNQRCLLKSLNTVERAEKNRFFSDSLSIHSGILYSSDHFLFVWISVLESCWSLLFLWTWIQHVCLLSTLCWPGVPQRLRLA